MASLSKVDAAYRSILLGKFFTKGWGNPNHLNQLFDFRHNITDREKCRHLVDYNNSIEIKKTEDNSSCTIYEGQFETPLYSYLPEVIPKESRLAKFQIVQPKHFSNEIKLRPLCIHLAGTGDHYYWRRRNLLAKPLLKEYQVTSIILENPFYGLRKPKTQVMSCLHNVSDIFVMGGCLCLESQMLLHWAEKNGFGPLAVTGLSMGGHMASIAGSNWPKPLAIVPCLSWSTASCVFTEGVMSGAIPWSLLAQQYKKEKAFSILHREQTSGSLAKALVTKLKAEKGIESAIMFMDFIMDCFTHLENFSLPVDPRLAIIINAVHDAYVPKHNVKSLNEIWQGSEIREVKAGHVQAFVLNQSLFRKAIVDALDKTAQLYYGEHLLAEDKATSIST